MKPPVPRGSRAREVLAGAAVFLLAEAVRLAALWELSASPTFRTPVVDGAGYFEAARALAEGRGWDTIFFFQSFFYPGFLAAAVRVFGASPLPAKLLQALLGGLTCLLAWRIGRRCFEETAGLLAGLVVAAYGPLVFFETELVPAGWAAFWSAALVLALLRAADQKGLPRAFVWGVCGALAGLTRAEAFPFLLVGTWWLWHVRARGGDSRRDLRQMLGAVALGWALVLLPVAGLNQRLNGHFTFLPASGGINLHVGNNPDRCGTLAIRPGWRWYWLESLPLRAGVRDIWEGERYFLRRVLEYVRSQPRDFSRGLAVKTLELVNSRESPRETDLYLYRQWSRLLGALVWTARGFGFPFGLLLPAAAAGWLLLWRKAPAPLLVSSLLTSLAIVLVFVSARYRVALSPLLAVMAAGGLVEAVRLARERSWRPLSAAALLFAGVLLASWLPKPACRERTNYEAELYFNVGEQKVAQGRIAAALPDFAKALELDPRAVEARSALGAALYLEGRREDGLAQLAEAVRLEPENQYALNNLGNALMAEGRLEEAQLEFQKVLGLNPAFPDAVNNMGVLRARRGSLGEARRHFERALSLKPGHAEAHHNLGKTLALAGDWPGARRHFSEALRLRPHFSEARENLERLPAPGEVPAPVMTGAEPR